MVQQIVSPKNRLSSVKSLALLISLAISCFFRCVHSDIKLLEKHHLMIFNEYSWTEPVEL